MLIQVPVPFQRQLKTLMLGSIFNWVNFQLGQFSTCQCHQFRKIFFKLLKNGSRYKFHEIRTQIPTMKNNHRHNIYGWKTTPWPISNSSQCSSLHQLPCVSIFVLSYSTSLSALIFQSIFYSYVFHWRSYLMLNVNNERG